MAYNLIYIRGQPHGLLREPKQLQWEERDLKIKGHYQEYHRELFWDPLCFFDTLMTLMGTFVHLSAFLLMIANYIELSNFEAFEDHQHLQCDLNSLTQWTMQWKMKLNPEKCEALRCTRSPTPYQVVYLINNQPTLASHGSIYLPGSQVTQFHDMVPSQPGYCK